MSKQLTSRKGAKYKKKRTRENHQGRSQFPPATAMSIDIDVTSCHMKSNRSI
jgi:hypothetical protein